MTSSDAVANLQSLTRQLDRLRSLLAKQTTRQLNSSALKSELKDFCQAYFRVVRPQFLRLGLALDTTDAATERLANLSNRRGAVSQYKDSVLKLKEHFQALEMIAEREMSDAASESSVIPTKVENQILSTLRQLSPTTAASYEQVLDDLSRSRLSFRGTATELREILRETLDILAPNSEVVGAPGFQLDKGRERPTMAQKARFILRQRGLASNSADAPKKAIEVVEGTVSSFVRSTYDRGSVDTHTVTGISKPQVAQLKMYVDTVLCEILEIHSIK